MSAAPPRTDPPRDLFSPRRGVVFGAGIVACVVAVVAEFVRGEGSLVDAAALLVGYVALFGGGNAVYERGYQLGRYARKVDAESWTTRIVRAARQHTRITWTALVSLLLVLAAAGYLAWFYTSASSQLVTGDIERLDHLDLADCYVEGPNGAPERLEGCDGVTLRLPGSPPARGHVTVVGHLTNQSDTGSCVDPARIVVAGQVDGIAGPATRARSGEPAVVSIEDATRTAAVEITIDQVHDDPVCRVALQITKVVLHH
ncbi:hypothetical protein [Myceligenerans pegani]|uniref:Uncharacterized protein n=1 Tax=Myceligenerans pegani TaxID=2776917 RepID=A0ABR9MVZ6_9MICO|nr:hypothetical protein [Myceligenerans sp. TRM 65318]MBE1874942.1 hypothetical protein [Myceligenerans sp. TRM 65318]MBE3017213.1 hypothetical protein [Myceligenerans sp. TRM 65318]